MVKRNVFIKWGRGERKLKVDLKDYKKVGKVGRFNLYSRKPKIKKSSKTKRFKVQGRKVRGSKTRSLYFTDRKRYFELKKKGRDAGRRYLKDKKKDVKTFVKVKGKRTKKPQKIEKVFEKKVSKITIKNFLDVPTNELNLQYKPLLRSVLNKKQLGDLASDDVLDVMIKQENINKIKWRFEIRADVYDRDGTKVLQMIRGSGGDLMSLRERMKKGVWRGASVDYDIDVGDGYIFKLINKGNVDRVEVTMIFRS